MSKNKGQLNLLREVKQLQLRAYQQQSVNEILSCVANGINAVLPGPTGTGKTEQIIAAGKSLNELGLKVAIVVNRQELVINTRDRAQMYGVDAGIIWRDSPLEKEHKLQIISIDSLTGLKLEFLYEQQPDVIFIDECHNHINKRGLKLYDNFSNKTFIGFSATPYVLGKWDDEFISIVGREFRGKPLYRDYDIFRSVHENVPEREKIKLIPKGEVELLEGYMKDGIYRNRFYRSLGYVYDRLITSPTAVELRDMGYLCDIEIYNYQEVNDLHGKLKELENLDKKLTKKFTEDFSEAIIQRLLCTHSMLDQITDEYIRICKDFYNGEYRPGVAFAGGVEHSQLIQAYLLKKGIPAEHVDANTSRRERDRIFDAYDKGDCKVICSVRVISEGFNKPQAQIGLCCAPTKSPIQHVQQVGRLLRPFPGKDKAILLDQSDNSRSLFCDQYPSLSEIGFHPYSPKCFAEVLTIKEPVAELPEEEEIVDKNGDGDEEGNKKIVELKDATLTEAFQVRETRAIISSWKGSDKSALVREIIFNVIPDRNVALVLAEHFNQQTNIDWLDWFFTKHQYIYYSLEGRRIKSNLSPIELLKYRTEMVDYQKNVTTSAVKLGFDVKYPMNPETIAEYDYYSILKQTKKELGPKKAKVLFDYMRLNLMRLRDDESQYQQALIFLRNSWAALRPKKKRKR